MRTRSGAPSPTSSGRAPTASRWSARSRPRRSTPPRWRTCSHDGEWAGLAARPHGVGLLVADDEGQPGVTRGVVLGIAGREVGAERVRPGLEDELDARRRLPGRVGRADRRLASELEGGLLADDGLTVLVHER